MASHKKTLNIIIWNATTVKNKTTEIQRFLSDRNAHVTINTEIWFTLVTSKNVIKISNYSINRKGGLQSSANKPRGSVLIAIHKSIPVEDFPQQITINIEIKMIKLK